MWRELALSRAFMRSLDVPEVNVVIFALLLNLPWELWQVPLFRNMPYLEHWQGIKLCTRATLGR